MSQGGGRVPITVLKLSFPSFEETPTLALRTGRMGSGDTACTTTRKTQRVEDPGRRAHRKEHFFIAEMKKNKIETMRQLR